MKTNPNLKRPINKDYFLDIKILDDQRQRFFDIYDRIVKLSKNKERITDDKIYEVLTELSNYLKYHFKTEENIMILVDYPDIEKHMKEHIFYIDKIDEFILAYKYKNPVLLDNMLAFSKKWFLSHIMQTDTIYKDLIKTNLKKVIRNYNSDFQE